MHLRELVSFRQIAYRILSMVLLYPDEERLNRLASVARELGNRKESLTGFAFFSQWNRILDSLQGLKNRKAEDLQGEYIRTFMVNPEGAPALPYESVYMNPEGWARGWITAQLEGEYAAAGLSLSLSLKELPDHAAVELEFMAFLCGEEAQAWEKKDLTKGIQVLERQLDFLGHHLSGWFPEFARRVCIADSGGIYPPLVEMAEAFITHDRDLLPILLERFQMARKWGKT